MRTLFKSQFILSILLASTGANAEVSFPRGCESIGFHYSNDLLVLNEQGHQTLYMIRNKSNHRVHLQYKEVKPVFMSPGWRTELKAQRWAAFASNETEMNFQCSIINRREIFIIPCKQVLDVCQYSRAKFAGSNMGNYWVAENKSLKGAIRASIKSGILLRW